MTKIALLLGLFLAVPAFAHDYWIEKDGKAFTLFQGHKHSTHGGAELVAYEPGIVKQALCSDEAGKSRALTIKGAPARIEAECAALYFELSSGYWSKTPWDTINKPKNEAKGVIQSWLSTETVKRLERWTSATAIPFGRGLEVSLPNNPVKLATGDKFIVLVTLDGAPVAGVPVAYDGETRGATDASGKINLRVRHGGLQIIAASQETPLTDGKADTLIRAATLVFQLP